MKWLELGRFGHIQRTIPLGRHCGWDGMCCNWTRAGRVRDTLGLWPCRRVIGCSFFSGRHLFRFIRRMARSAVLMLRGGENKETIKVACECREKEDFWGGALGEYDYISLVGRKMG